MHTMQLGNFTIHFNGDFSGDIIVNLKDEKVAKIPFMVMLAVVGEKLRREQIAKLEGMDPMDMVYPDASKGW